MTVSKRTVSRPGAGVAGRVGAWTTSAGRRSCETTVELIRERGLWEVRLADVAERAGISATSVVYYFGTKDELFAEAIQAADEAFYEPLADEFERHPAAAERIVLLLRHSAAQRLAAVDRPVGVLAPPSRDGGGAAPLPRALADDDRGDRPLRMSRPASGRCPIRPRSRCGCRR